MSFQSYLDDLNSSTGCCRSASLLVPSNRETNHILHTLRQWKWICQSVLIRPWRRGSSVEDKECSPDDSWYYHCLPNEEELLFFQNKYSSSSESMQSASVPSAASLRKELVHKHLESKSLLVPLTDDATAFILNVLFKIPMCIPDNLLSSEDEEHHQKVTTIHKWFALDNAVAIIHNCDGNQTVSLCKEVDSFPKQPTSSANRDHSNGSKFTFVDLFAGIGGFRIGMEALGGKCIGSCEIDPFARDTYLRNFRGICNEREEFFVNDITRLEIPPDTADILCGGFPCQSFSTMASFPSNKRDDSTKTTSSGQNGSRRQGGLDTPHKGKLFFHLLRILRKSRPKIFIFENVKGLMKIDNGSHFRKILQLLEESGYQVTHGIVDTSWFLPQRRERVYFVGIRLDLLKNMKRSIVSPSQEQFSAELRRKYQIYGNGILHAADMDKFDRVLQHNNGNQHLRCLDPSYSLPPSRLGDILESHETVSSNHSHCFLTPSQWQRVQNQGYLQLHQDGSGKLLTEDDICAQTLVSSYRQSFLMHSQFVVPRDSLYLAEQRKRLVAEAYKNQGFQGKRQDPDPFENEIDEGHGVLPRFFTPRECCRLQGFPENFMTGDTKQRNLVSQFYRQIGNAVSPPCVAAVAENVVSSYLISSNKEHHNTGSRTSPVFSLILDASPKREKLMAGIDRKSQDLAKMNVIVDVIG